MALLQMWFKPCLNTPRESNETEGSAHDKLTLTTPPASSCDCIDEPRISINGEEFFD
jgi:hypothetical protein